MDALANAPATHRGPQCSVGAFLATADEDVATSLRAALDSDRVTAKSIADTLSRYGPDVTAYTVARHRRRGQSNGCRCER
ncbi:hypothetical protein KVH27_35275 [Streptomyces olivaceus]|nr:hypothetical protein [Streptomyces olivaceus]